MNNQDWIKQMNEKLQKQREDFQKSIDEGETFKRKQSYSAKHVFDKNTGIWNMDQESKKEAEKKGGKTGASGKSQVENGTYKKRAIAGGKVTGPIQGKKNVESGHWKKCIKLGGEATKNKWKNIHEERIQQILKSGIVPDDWFTRKYLLEVFIKHDMYNEMNSGGKPIERFLKSEYVVTKGNGRNKMYKKLDK